MECSEISESESLFGSQNLLPAWVEKYSAKSKDIGISSTLKKRKMWDLEAAKLYWSTLKDRPHTTLPSCPTKQENTCSLPSSTSSTHLHVPIRTTSADNMLSPACLMTFKDFLPKSENNIRSYQIIKTPTNETKNLMQLKIRDYYELKTILSQKEEETRQLKIMIRQKEENISRLRKLRRKYYGPSCNKRLFRQHTYIVKEEEMENDTFYEEFCSLPISKKMSITRQDRAEEKHLLRMYRPLSARLYSPVRGRDSQRCTGRFSNRRSRSSSPTDRSLKTCNYTPWQF